MVSLVALAPLAVSLGLAPPPPALAVPISATASHGPPARVYGGGSSQNHPMSLRLTRDGKRLREHLSPR